LATATWQALSVGASVTSGGLVTAVTSGTVTIMATYEEKSGLAMVQISPTMPSRSSMSATIDGTSWVASYVWVTKIGANQRCDRGEDRRHQPWDGAARALLSVLREYSAVGFSRHNRDSPEFPPAGDDMEAIDAKVGGAAVTEDLGTPRSLVLRHFARFTSRGSTTARDGAGEGASSSRARPSSTARL